MASSERKSRNSISIDPDRIMGRYLHYRERQSGFTIFRSLFWSIYLVIIGVLLELYSSISFTVTTFLGTSILLLAVMLIISGFVNSLHQKLMKRYG